MKVVVITAITAGRDSLKENQNTGGAEFVAFCDRPLSSATWEVRPACNLFRDPVRNAKIHKILPHLYFPEHDFSLWIDGTLELADPAPLLIEQYLADREAVFGRHPVHRSLDEEIEACFREVLDDPGLIREQMATYRAGATDSGFPLASTILRRHSPRVTHFNAVWWAEICRWSRRDQLGLLDAATRVGLNWGYFPRSPELERDPQHRHLGSPHFRWYPHGTGVAIGQDEWTAASTDIDPPSWRMRRLEFLEAVSGEREAYALSLESELWNRTRWAEEAERYAKSLEGELERQKLAVWKAERYARELEQELRRAGRRPRDVS